MNCTTCSGRGTIQVPTDYGNGTTAVRCAACSGTGRRAGDPDTLPMVRNSAAGGAVTFAAELLALLQAVPHDSASSWSAWCVTTAFQAEATALLIHALCSGSTVNALGDSQRRLLTDLRALLGRRSPE